VSKLLILLVAVVIVYLAVTALARKGRERPAPPSSGEPMVPCAHCGVNLPRSEALGEAGRFFCSEEHRRLGAG